MGLPIFSGKTFGALTQALDATALRQEAIASNLANANTPGYKRKDVSFALELAERRHDSLALAGSNTAHLDTPDDSENTPPTVVTDAAGAMRLDGNNIDPDAEAARLAETEVTYAALTQALSAQFASLRIAITGSSRA